MNIDISKIITGSVNSIDVEKEVVVDKETLEKSGIIELNSTKVTGRIHSILDNIFLTVNIKGEMVLPCAVTLKPVKYPFEVDIDEDIYELLEEIGIFVKKSENLLDIFPIIWENILMEIPIRVVSDDASSETLSGDGWKFITDEKPECNPELEKLKDLL